METAIGQGCVAIGSIKGKNERIGLLLEQTCEPHDINGPVPDGRAQPGQPFEVKENDVVIWIDNIEAARVLQDRLNMICLKLEGYNVDL